MHTKAKNIIPAKIAIGSNLDTYMVRKFKNRRKKIADDPASTLEAEQILSLIRPGYKPLFRKTYLNGSEVEPFGSSTDYFVVDVTIGFRGSELNSYIDVEVTLSQSRGHRYARTSSPLQI